MTQLHSPEIERSLLLAQNALTQLGQHISQAAAAVDSLGPERQTALARELWSELSGLVSSVDELMVSVFAARALFLLFSLRPLLNPPPSRTPQYTHTDRLQLLAPRRPPHQQLRRVSNRPLAVHAPHAARRHWRILHHHQEEECLT